MLDSIFKALAAGLSIWEHKEKNKYVERLMDLKRRYREEWSKAPELRSDAVIDNITFEVKLLVDSFATSVADTAK
jgi:hypothetical protein